MKNYSVTNKKADGDRDQFLLEEMLQLHRGKQKLSTGSGDRRAGGSEICLHLPGGRGATASPRATPSQQANTPCLEKHRKQHGELMFWAQH